MHISDTLACNERAKKETQAAARELISPNLEGVNRMIGQRGWGGEVINHEAHPHSPHDVRQVKDKEVLCCNTCGLYAQLRTCRMGCIKSQCIALKAGNASALRLL